LESAQLASAPRTFSGLDRQIAALTVAMCPRFVFAAAVFQGSPTQ
jgi:hypothetical protein